MTLMIVGYDCLGGVLILFAVVVTVWYLHRMNEMQLRRERIRYREELPLDRHGIPLYLPEGAQVNPERQRAHFVEERAPLKDERDSFSF
jgi:hypothetical protein